jgi:hypothetical protein
MIASRSLAMAACCVLPSLLRVMASWPTDTVLVHDASGFIGL